MNPGIYQNIPFADYQAIDAMNNTILKLLNRTPAHAYYAMTHPEEPTEAFRIGDATHKAILEPKLFEEKYAKAPSVDRRTNAGKAEYAAWQSANGDKMALTAEDWNMAVALRDAVRLHPIARELLSGKGQNEMTVVWRDGETGILCKGRLDRFTMYQNWETVVDLKTAQDASIKGFGKACATYDYHQQAAFYLDGLDALAPHKRRFVHIVVEKSPPYCTAVLELDDAAIEEGRAKYRKAMTLLSECRAKKEWPGYAAGIDEITIPNWAFEHIDPTNLRM